MRAKKIWFIAVSVASILLSILILIIYFDVFIPLDEQFKNLDNIIMVMIIFLIAQSGALLNRDSKSDRSPFCMATRKDRGVGYLTGILFIFIICVIGFFIAPTYVQALFMVALGYLLWGGMMYIFGSEDLKNKLRVNQSKKDTSVLITSGIIVFLILGVITFIVNLTEGQGFLLLFLALGLWGGLIYVFGSDDLKKWFFPSRRSGTGNWWDKNENTYSKK